MTSLPPGLEFQHCEPVPGFFFTGRAVTDPAIQFCGVPHSFERVFLKGREGFLPDQLKLLLPLQYRSKFARMAKLIKQFKMTPNKEHLKK
jgi:hypothetical protein